MTYRLRETQAGSICRWEPPDDFSPDDYTPEEGFFLEEWTGEKWRVYRKPTLEELIAECRDEVTGMEFHAQRVDELLDKIEARLP